MDKILPLKTLRSLLETSNLPGLFGGREYISTCYKQDPTLFTYWYNKSQRSAKNRNFGKMENSLWIAANCVSTILKYPHCFYCYYCMLNFDNRDSNIKPEFEHFTPKLQEAGNIAFACSFCNRLKNDTKPEEFWEQLYNEKILKGLQLKNKHFVPLVVRHHPSSANYNWKTLDWLNFMKTFAKDDFGIEIVETQQYDIVSSYCRLFRQKYIEL